MWRSLTDNRGISGRDQLWGHPDLLPSAEDLDDPDGFVLGRPELDLSGFTDEARPEAGDEPDGGAEGTPDGGDDPAGSQ